MTKNFTHIVFLSVFFSSCLLSKAQDVAVKEISLELNCGPKPLLLIDNQYWQINIRTTRHNKIKMVTSVPLSLFNKSRLSARELFSALNLSLKTTETGVIVKGDLPSSDKWLPVRSASASSEGFTSDLLVLHGSLTLYIPSGTSLDVDSKYGNISVEDDLQTLKASINNASLRLQNCEVVNVRSSYAAINAGNIRDAQFDVANSKLDAGHLENLVVSSKFSDVELRSVENAVIQSTNDQYEIGNVFSLSGHKDYGAIRISSLYKTLDLSGVNTDIKIRHIESSSSIVRINNRFANICLPLNSLRNYSITYDGDLSTIYAPFHKLLPNPYSTSKIRHRVGNLKGKFVDFRLRCDNCTIDFR